VDKVAFVFPGQGAQVVGMAADLYRDYKSAAQVFDTAGDEVKNICFNGPQSELDLTVNAQPCLFAADLACAAALNEAGVHFDGAAGFSLGEIPALVSCGLLDIEQALSFVNFRAKTMHEAALSNPGGMMAVLGLSAAQVIEICDGIDGAYPANFNGEKQTVVAFAEAAYDELNAAVTANRGRGVRLATSGPFHSPFMDDASAVIGSYLDKLNFNEMTIPLYANATGQIYTDARGLLTHQVNSPVLWTQTIENMINDGFGTFIEAGPGKTLCGLIKKINKDVKVYTVYERLIEC
jgi:[acyl-carrier-protein] S-malonyltransferase